MLRFSVIRKLMQMRNNGLFQTTYRIILHTDINKRINIRIISTYGLTY